MFAVRVLVLLALAACARAPEPVAGVRDLSRPVYSIAGFDAARLSGDWVQVAGFGPCAGGRLGPGGFDLCLPVGRAKGQLQATGVPGRYQTPEGPAWVLWADADDRTLVLGGPDGGVVAVLNREGGISADRMKAARDILAFNGYDVSRLVAY